MSTSSPTENDSLLPTDESQSIKSNERTKKSHAKRFWAYCAWGLFFIIGFNLTFLPRTSLSRDFRRIHGVKLTKADVRRYYLSALANENYARDWLHKYTHQPHLAGDGYDLVKFTEDKFKEYGLKTYIHQYDVWLNTPEDSSLTLLDTNDNSIYNASLVEDVLEEDETTGYNNSIPAFHGYSASGNVTAEFVFANYGSRDDFASLRASGINVTGKIAIIRYGQLFRGLKVKFAQENGAAGVVLYSDPFDDGNVTVANGYEAYPKGKARNPSSIQRGSVEYFTDNPGDPTTPGYASKKGVKRQDPKDFIPHIPSLPISARSIAPILRKLNGGKQLNWTGDIDEFDYSPGPSDYKLNLYNLQDYKIKPIYNVLGKIEGILDNEEIIIANHRDSWIVGGSADPNSGSAVLLEIARGFGELLKKGWKPLRTITFASWDGEEYAMLGSTEFGEEFAKNLQKKQVAYLNLDVAVSGSDFGISSNPLINKAIHEVAKLVPFQNDPEKTLYDQWYAQDNATISTIGAGSDFVVFQHHLGIPSVDLGFTDNGKTDAVYHYHSNYDSFYWMDKFVDPGYSLHSTIGQFLGLLTIDLSEHEIVHFSTAQYAQKINESLIIVESKILDDWLDLPLPVNKMDKSILASLENFFSDKKEITLTDFLTYTKASIASLISAAGVFDDYSRDLQTGLITDYPWFKFYKKIALIVKIKVANYKLIHLDRLFLSEGLKNRQWMKHSVFGPHREYGYSGDVLPGLHEAVRDSDFDETIKWLEILLKQFKAMERKLS